jgi:hypothetical protein
LDGVAYNAGFHDAREGFSSEGEDDERELPPAKIEETHVAEDKEKDSAEFKGVFRT